MQTLRCVVKAWWNIPDSLVACWLRWMLLATTIPWVIHRLRRLPPRWGSTMTEAEKDRRDLVWALRLVCEGLSMTPLRWHRIDTIRRRLGIEK